MNFLKIQILIAFIFLSIITGALTSGTRGVRPPNYNPDIQPRPFPGSPISSGFPPGNSQPSPYNVG